MMRYVLVTGGVLSGIGKGVIASSTGVIMKALGFQVTAIKIDPYLNIDAGTMSPFEHGEVFVLDDGGEADLDLGNYERFLNVTLGRDNNITTGKIYNQVIEKERQGKYLGKTVQVIPHVTDAIQEWIERVANTPLPGCKGAPDMCIIELGGTVGDIESSPFIEAMRQFQFRVGRENFCSIHVSLVPVLGSVGEQKTKPTQQSVQSLRALGIMPDVIICRSSLPISDEIKSKVSMFCHVPQDAVIGCHDVSNIYRVPLLLQSQQLEKLILRRTLLFSPSKGPSLDSWKTLADRMDKVLEKNSPSTVHIAVVGKYTGLADSYLSIIKALQHAALDLNTTLSIDWVESIDLEDKYATNYEKAWTTLKAAHGVLVPGGFGARGILGMILACNWARKLNVPFLGICLGLQVATIEFARNVLEIPEADSTEFKPECEHPAVIFMPEGSKTHMGGTMRLGQRRTLIKDETTKISRLYARSKLHAVRDEEGRFAVDERHRHRYEINPELVSRLEEKGLHFVGQDETGKRMEIFELKDHKYYVGTQFHPEFKSRPTLPSPPFIGLILAATSQLEEYLSLAPGRATSI